MTQEEIYQQEIYNSYFEQPPTHHTENYIVDEEIKTKRGYRMTPQEETEENRKFKQFLKSL